MYPAAGKGQAMPTGGGGPAEAQGTAAAGGAAAAGGGEPERAPLARFVAFNTVAEFSFIGGVWILYLRDRGFSLGEIGLAEAVFHLAPIVLELPSGSLADLLGRKWSLVVGALLIAASSALLLAADSLWLLLPSMFLSGASYAFRSGATQAFLYDALAERREGDRFAAIWGKLLSASYVVFAVTTWLGGVLAERNFAWPVALMVGAGLVAAWLAAGLREPPRERTAHRSVVGTIGEAVRIIRQRPGLAQVLGFGAALFTLATLVGLYAQAVLAERGLAPGAIGLVLGVTFGCTALGSWFAGRFGARGGFPGWTPPAVLAVVGSALGMGGGTLAGAVGLYLLAEFVTGVYEPLLASRVNAGLPSAQRATILSVQGFLFSLTMIWAFPLFGFAAERVGWLLPYAVASAAVVALLAAWWGVLRQPVDATAA